MKLIFPALLLLLSVAAFGQEDTSRYQRYTTSYGMQVPRIWATKILRLPDTVNNINSLPGAIAYHNGVVYTWNGSGWVANSGGSGSITLTTTGTSGAATLSGGVLNIPQYSGGSGTTYSNGPGLLLSTGVFKADSSVANQYSLTTNTRTQKLIDSLKAVILAYAYGTGSVTTVSVATANGVSGSVANAATTPAITLSLGAITPTSVNASGTVTGSNLSGNNNGDETTSTIQTKLGNIYKMASDSAANAASFTNRGQHQHGLDSLGAVKQNVLTPGTNISIVGNTISATGSGSSSTGDSSRASYAETKIVTIPLSSTILYLGDSYFTLGGAYNIPLIVDSLTGSFADNRAIGGTGVNTSISQAFKYDSLGKFKPTFIEIGLNNLSFCGSSIGTIEAIKGGIRSHIVNHFLASAIPASASTQSSGWTNVTAGTIGAKADLSLAGNAVTVSTAGATLTYTTPATTSIAIGTFGSDSTTSDYGRFNYTVDGVFKGTWISNGKNRYNSTFNLPLSQQVIVVNNLARTTHTVVITTLDAKPVVVDYFGTMIIKDAGLQPLLIASIPRLTDSGYRAAILRIDNINSDRGVDSGSRAILSVLNEFSSFNYPLAFVDVNKYLQVPNDISADSVHPTNIGSYKIANSYMEHVSAWQAAVQSFDIGKPNANRMMTLSSLPTGGGTITGPSFIGLNTSLGKIIVSNPQSTANNLLDLNGYANNPRIRLYSTTAALTWTLQAGYNMVAWNIDPDLGTYKNSGVPGGLIKFNTVSGNGAIDYYLSNTNGGGGTFVSRWSVLGLKLGSNANPAAQLDIIGGTTTQPQIKLNPGVLTTTPGIGNIENDSVSNVIYFTDRNGLRKPIAPLQITTTGINAKTAASTTLYTVPTGKTLVVTRCVVRVTAASGITTGLSASVTASTSGTIYTSNAMTGLTATPQLFKFPDDGISVTASAGETINFVIGTAATGTSQTVAVDLIGYLLGFNSWVIIIGIGFAPISKKRIIKMFKDNNIKIAA